MRGRGAAERGRGRAQRPSVGVVGRPPESSAGFRGARPQDRSHGSVVRNGAVTFAIARLRRRVFVQSTEPEVVTEKALEGQNPGEHRPGRPWASSGASSRDFAVGRVNGLPGGARLRSGRNGRVPASPKVSCVGRRGRRAGQLARWTGGLSRSRGNHVPASSVSSACPLHGGLRARLGRGAWWKPVGQPGNLRAGDTVDVEPTRKQKAAERRHGSPGRESSEGRIPGTFVVGQPTAKAQGRSDDGTAGAGKLDLAGVGAAQTAEGQRKPGRERLEHQEHRKVSWVSWVSSVEWTKPEGGTGRGCGNSRLPRSVEPVVAETGHPESNVVGTKNPRRGGPERWRKPAIRRRKPLGQCTPVVL